MNTRYLNLLVSLASALLLVTSVSAKTKEQASPNAGKASSTNTNDLRPRMKQMKLKDGPNLVYQGNGYKLTANARGGKVTGWSATDLKGKPLVVQEEKGKGGGGGDTKPIVTCEVCVTIQTGSGETKSCSKVDCSILTKQ